MSKSAYPLKLPTSVKTAAAELAERAGRAKPRDLLRYLRKAPKAAPVPGDGCAD